MNNETILLQKNIWIDLPNTLFFHATNGKKASQHTEVRLKADDQFLNVEFICDQNPFVNENSYFENNSEMYNQEVFEIFISTGENTPKRYLEIEINPNNALFVAWIKNETGQNPDSLNFIEHNESGIMHGVQKGADKWQGFLNIPLGIIGSKSATYRVNFYRIISKESHKNSNWKCTQSNCDFICYYPTMSGNSPAFHRPNAFGILKILG